MCKGLSHTGQCSSYYKTYTVTWLLFDKRSKTCQVLRSPWRGRGVAHGVLHPSSSPVFVGFLVGNEER